MGMEAADSMRTPGARNASFDHARRYAVIAGQLFRGCLRALHNRRRRLCILTLDRHHLCADGKGAPSTRFRSSPWLRPFGVARRLGIPVELPLACMHAPNRTFPTSENQQRQAIAAGPPHDGPGHRRRRLYRKPHGRSSMPASASWCSTTSRPVSIGR